MAKVKTKSKSGASAHGNLVIKLGPSRKGPEMMVRFGSVEVRDATFNPAEKRRNVDTGREALSRAVLKIVKAGFTRSAIESAPRYRADPNNPQVLIRELDGKSARGTFVDGKFKAFGK